MPDSGDSRPCLRVLNITARSSVFIVMLLMTSAIAWTVPSRPQNVPSRPRKMQRPVRYRARSRLSSSRAAMLSRIVRIAGALSISRPRFSPSMRAIGDKRRSSGCTASARSSDSVVADSLALSRRRSTHRASGASRITWRKFRIVPIRMTAKITPFTAGLTRKIGRSVSARKAQPAAITTRNSTMRVTYREVSLTAHTVRKSLWS